MSSLFNDLVVTGLSRGVAERYKGYINNVSKLISILYSICSDKIKFSKLFYCEKGAVLCMDPSRRKMDRYRLEEQAKDACKGQISCCNAEGLSSRLGVDVYAYNKCGHREVEKKFKVDDCFSSNGHVATQMKDGRIGMNNIDVYSSMYSKSKFDRGLRPYGYKEDHTGVYSPAGSDSYYGMKGRVDFVKKVESGMTLKEGIRMLNDNCDSYSSKYKDKNKYDKCDKGKNGSRGKECSIS